MAHGGRRPGAGRKKGQVTQRTQDGEAFARGLITDPDYVTALKARLRAGQAPHMETLLTQLAYGKPVERRVLEGNPDAPIQVQQVQYGDGHPAP
jgi:hypothetical protein